MDLHPITAESFAIIDQEVGPHGWPAEEYSLIRRAIHATADFELLHLFEFTPGSVQTAKQAIRARMPMIVDVRMIAVAVESAVKQAGIPLYCALDYAPDPVQLAGQTRTAAGMSVIAHQHPHSLFVVGNAPTALLTLVDLVQQGILSPALIVGVPVGFVAVAEAKQALTRTAVPYIQVQGRKGGSAIAAALIHALIHLADQDQT